MSKRQKNIQVPTQEGENAEASKQATNYDDFDARVKTFRRELRANAAIQRMQRQRPVDAEQKRDKERQKPPTEAEQKRDKERQKPPTEAEQKRENERLKREKAALQRRERERERKCVEQLLQEVTKLMRDMTLSKYDSTPLRF